MTTADDDQKDRHPFCTTCHHRHRHAAYCGHKDTLGRIAERAFRHGVREGRRKGSPFRDSEVQPAPVEEKHATMDDCIKTCLDSYADLHKRHQTDQRGCCWCNPDRRKGGERRMGGEVKNKGFYVLVYNKTPYGAEMKVAPERRTLIPGFDSWASVERRKSPAAPSTTAP